MRAPSMATEQSRRAVSSRGKSRRGVKLAEQLANELVREITLAGLQPGDKLASEVKLAQARGVSRTAMREALRILEVHGVVAIKTGPNGGPEVLAVTSQDFARMATLHFNLAGVTFRQLLDARLILEPRMAELAALKRTAAQLDALDRNVDRHAIATRVDEIAHCANEFHGLVAACGGSDNSAFALITSALYDIFDIQVSTAGGEETMRRVAADHASIRDAIHAGDAAGAAALMERHMKDVAVSFAEDHPTLIDQTVTWLTG